MTDSRGLPGMTERWQLAGDRLVHAVEWDGRVAGVIDPVPVVLVHGLGGSTVNWELVGAEMADELATRVIAFDLVGFGRTPLGSRRASVGVNRDLLVELLEEIGPAIVVGNSMGGAISIGLAAREPDLVRALVLVDAALPRPLRPPGIRESVRGMANLSGLAVSAIPGAGPQLVRYRVRQLGAPGTVDSILRVACLYPERVDPVLRARLVELAEYRSAGDDSARSYHDAVLSLLSYTAHGLPTDIRTVSVPTLMIHGARDHLVPISVARATSRRRKDWTFEVFDDCGHVPMIEQPERFVAVTTDWILALADADEDYEEAAGGSSR